MLCIIEDGIWYFSLKKRLFILKWENLDFQIVKTFYHFLDFKIQEFKSLKVYVSIVTSALVYRQEKIGII